jgi:hypothetical protein
MSNLACMREGLAPELATLHANTLQSMKYYIKTQHGCNDFYNGHMKPDPFLGSGQGAGDSMARWGFVSDTIIRAYNKRALSAPITAPISHTKSTNNIQAFVDDSHGIIIHNQNKNKTLQELIEQNMQTWEHLLHTVGGKLEISKCQFVRFNDDDNLHNNDHQIEIIDHENGQTQSIKEI